MLYCIVGLGIMAVLLQSLSGFFSDSTRRVQDMAKKTAAAAAENLPTPSPRRITTTTTEASAAPAATQPQRPQPSTTRQATHTRRVAPSTSAGGRRGSIWY